MQNPSWRKMKNIRNHQATDTPAAPIDQEKSGFFFNEERSSATVELPGRHWGTALGFSAGFTSEPPQK